MCRWNGKLQLTTVFGKPEDSLEFAIFVRSRKMDLFWLYDNADTWRILNATSDDKDTAQPPTDNGSWVGGMVAWKKQKLRWSYTTRIRPLAADGDDTNICTAEMHGSSPRSVATF